MLVLILKSDGKLDDCKIDIYIFYVKKSVLLKLCFSFKKNLQPPPPPKKNPPTSDKS
jgi:hypothetical protein